MGTHPVASTTQLVVGVAIEGQLLRDGLVLLLEDEGAVRVATAANSLAELDATCDLDVIVIHVRGDLDPQLADLPAVLAGRAPVRVVGVHDSLAAPAFAAALHAGVTVLVDLESGFDAILEAIVGTRDRSLRRWVRPQVGIVPLTRREREVLQLIAVGRTSSEIAMALGISAYTVEHHKGRVFRKLSATSQSQAVAIALREGLIDNAVANEIAEHDEMGRAETPTTTAVVLGPRTVLARSTTRVLQSGGIEIVETDDVKDHTIAVMIEPTAADWDIVDGAALPAIVLTGFEPDRDTLLTMVAKGAHAVLLTSCDPAHLVATAVQVANGETGLTRAQTRRLSEALRGRAVSGRALDTTTQRIDITARELEILQTLDRGLSVKQAAKELGISPRTVENTRRVLYRKLGVRNRAEAIATAFAAGIIGRSAVAEPHKNAPVAEPHKNASTSAE